jgi:signal recognition particle GTPase
MRNSELIIKSVIINITMIFLFSFVNLYAQSANSGKLDDSEIANLISKLQQKVLLTDSQANSVKNILNSYRTELISMQSSNSNSKYSSKQQLINDTLSKIISLLDEKQKMKFDIIKDGWWSNVTSEEND